MTESRQNREPRGYRVLSQATLRALATRRQLLGGSLGAAAALGLGGSALASTSRSGWSAYEQAQEELSIIIGTLGDASTINPLLASDSEDEWRCKMLYDEFVRQDPVDYSPQPGIASEWAIDGLTYTFTIQPNAKFSDGTDLTADDVAFTLKGFLTKEVASPKRDRFSLIEGAQAFIDGTATDITGIKVVDPKTIQITLGQQDASFLYSMRFVWVLPKALLDGKSLTDDPFFQAPVGAGPFKFESWSANADFVALKNENFWETGKPAITQFTHRVIADSQSLVIALQSNEIDASNYPAPTGRDLLAENTDLDLIVPPFGAPNGWLFNLANEHLAKKDVRKAIAMALNSEQFAADSLLGLSGPGLGPIAPDSWAHDATLTPIPFDPEAAKALIDASGSAGAQIRFAVNSGNIFREDWLTYTQQALQEIGIEVIPELVDYAVHVTAVTSNHDFDVTGIDFTGAASDPGNLALQFKTGASGNYIGYSNPDLDALLDQARDTPDIEAAKPIYAEIQKILMDDVPAHWAWYRPFLHAVNKAKFAGYIDSGDYQLFYTLRDWTAATA
jgi:peptide/nickel transport system substrate-binding protein